MLHKDMGVFDYLGQTSVKLNRSVRKGLSHSRSDKPFDAELNAFAAECEASTAYAKAQITAINAEIEALQAKSQADMQRTKALFPSYTALNQKNCLDQFNRIAASAVQARVYAQDQADRLAIAQASADRLEETKARLGHDVLERLGSIVELATRDIIIQRASGWPIMDSAILGFVPPVIYHLRTPCGTAYEYRCEARAFEHEVSPGILMYDAYRAALELCETCFADAQAYATAKLNAGDTATKSKRNDFKHDFLYIPNSANYEPHPFGTLKEYLHQTYPFLQNFDGVQNAGAFSLGRSHFWMPFYTWQALFQEGLEQIMTTHFKSILDKISHLETLVKRMEAASAQCANDREAVQAVQNRLEGILKSNNDTTEKILTAMNSRPSLSADDIIAAVQRSQS